MPALYKQRPMQLEMPAMHHNNFHVSCITITDLTVTTFLNNTVGVRVCRTVYNCCWNHEFVTQSPNCRNMNQIFCKCGSHMLGLFLCLFSFCVFNSLVYCLTNVQLTLFPLRIVTTYNTLRFITLVCYSKLI